MQKMLFINVKCFLPVQIIMFPVRVYGSLMFMRSLEVQTGMNVLLSMCVDVYVWVWMWVWES